MGYAGRAGAGTPNIDALAARGSAYTSAVTPSPEAPAALGSLLTGQYPARNGLRTAETDRLGDAVVTLAETLKAQGYRTRAFTSSVLLHPKYGFGRGFDTYTSFFEDAPHPSDIPDAGFPAKRAADQALEYLETARNVPFFLWVNFFDPHAPYTPAEPFATAYKDDLYQGELAYVDQEVGRLLKKIKDYGLEPRTVVVFAGSCGEGLGDHGETYHGITLSRSTTQVPLVIAGPSLDAGTKVAAPASLVDVYPTILALLGLPKGASDGATLDGLSLLDAADMSRPLFMQTRMPARLFGWAPLTAVLSGPFKYILGVRAEMYDTSADPGETHDIAASQPATRDRLAGLASDYADRSARASTSTQAGLAAARALGYAIEPRARAPKDSRDMVAAGNDALKGHFQLRRNSLQASWFLFQGVLASDPDNYIALLDTALMTGAKRDLDGAAKLLHRVRDLYPERAEPYHQLGHLVWNRDKEKGPGQARALWKVAAMLDALNEEAQYDAACALAAEGKPGESLDQLEKAIAAGFHNYAFMATDPDLDSVRTDPRFESITGGKAKKPPAPSGPPPAK